MSVPFFDLTRQYERLESEVRPVIDDVMRSQHFIMGPNVEAIEREIAGYLGIDKTIGCASGTDALLLPLKGIKAEAGDEVVVPAFTFFATAGAVWNAGLTPVFCDVDPETFMMTRASVEAVMTERTRAIIPVHLFGQMAPMAELTALAIEKDLVVIEDVAQSMGARQICDGSGSQAGTLGDVGTFSFFPTKNLGCFGDGGLVSIQNEAIGDYVERARTHGGRQMYSHEFVGTNSRLDSLQAAILRVKLPHLPGWIAARRRNASVYFDVLSDVEGLILPHTPSENEHTFNQFTVRCSQRSDLVARLTEKGVGSKVYYPAPLHLQSCFSKLGGREGEIPTSEHLCGEVLSLPIFPELTESEVTEAAEAVRSFYSTSPP